MEEVFWQKEYIPCENCYGYYKSSELWKHVRRCTLATCSSSLRSKRVVQFSRLFLPVHQEASEGLKAVLATLSSDDVSRIVKSDSLILKLGETMFKRHGHDKEQYSILPTKMRELARLLRSLRHTSGKPHASLDDFINPSHVVLKDWTCTEEMLKNNGGRSMKTNKDDQHHFTS